MDGRNSPLPAAYQAADIKVLWLSPRPTSVRGSSHTLTPDMFEISSDVQALLGDDLVKPVTPVVRKVPISIPLSQNKVSRPKPAANYVGASFGISTEPSMINSNPKQLTEVLHSLGPWYMTGGYPDFSKNAANSTKKAVSVAVRDDQTVAKVKSTVTTSGKRSRDEDEAAVELVASDSEVVVTKRPRTEPVLEELVKLLSDEKKQQQSLRGQIVQSFLKSSPNQ